MTKPSFFRAVASLLLGAASAAAPVHARADSATGSIVLPGASNAARSAYLIDEGFNGLVGYVVRLGAPVPDNTPYSLVVTSSTGPATVQAEFYSDLLGENGEGFYCGTVTSSPNGSGGENGSIVCGDSNGDGHVNGADRARYAIVTVPRVSTSPGVGAKVTFKLNWSS